MKKVLIASISIVLIFLFLGISFGDTYTTTSIGNFDFVSGPNYSGTGTRIGNFYFYNDNYGSATSTRIGNTTFTNIYSYDN